MCDKRHAWRRTGSGFQVGRPAPANSYRKTYEPASAVISFTSTGAPSAVYAVRVMSTTGVPGGSAALSRAVREELITRNVARLVELPAWAPRTIEPWSPAEALAFLTAAADDRLYPAFALLLLYGMRRGEVLGLPWQDIDLNRNILHVRTQLQRINGELHIGPVKTSAGARDLPLLGLASSSDRPASESGSRPRPARLQLDGDRACLHDPYRAAGRAAQSGPVLHSPLRRSRRPQDPPACRSAHHRLAAQRTLAFRRETLRSLGTHTSRPRSRYTRTWTRLRGSTPSPC